MDHHVSTSLVDLEHMIDNESAEPKALSFSVLDEITNGFSEDHEIGEGGFAVVYRGILGNGKVAVKKLTHPHMNETEFQREVENLMKLRHKNIVRFLGYCADTQGVMHPFGRKSVMADLQRRLLCFEYVSNGSLHNHISDASGGLEWRKRYRIIKGVCEGLNYLHKNRIVHLDLKPSNILMDDDMEPKIADFGLSRCFDEDQTHIMATKLVGTVGYWPPEFDSRKVTQLYDIYGLGVIIMEILTGKKGYHEVEEVLDSWRNRLKESLEYAELEQIRICAMIGDECTEKNPDKRPRSLQKIIDRLKKTEWGDDSSSVDQIPSMPTERGLLHVHQSQLRFPLFEPEKLISSPLRLTNNTNDHVAFRCFPKLPDSFTDGLSGLKGIVPPRCTRTFLVSMEKEPPKNLETFDVILESCVGHKDVTENPDDNFLPKMRKRLGGKVHRIPLVAVYHQAVGGSVTTSEQFRTQTKIICRNFRSHLASMDVHPTEPWILLGFNDGSVAIWNYETQAKLIDLKIVQNDVVARYCMFIAREHWIVVGDGNGDIHVRSCKTLELDEVKKYKAHTDWIQAMTAHPSLPLLLSGGKDRVIKLWNWEKNWTWIRSFHGHTSWVEDLRFNPYDDDSTDDVTFASAAVDCTAKIWDISLPLPITTLYHDDRLLSVDFLKCAEGQYVVTGAHDEAGRLWNLRTQQWVRQIKGTFPGHGCKVRVIDRLPDPPLLIIALQGYNIGLCDPTTLRYKNTIGFGLGVARSFVYVKGIRSVVIGFENGLAALEID